MSTVREALIDGASRLFDVDTPFLDASVLLAHALGVSKEKLIASYPDPLPPEVLSLYHEYLDARRRGIPVSYIRRKKEFYGLPFYVDERVLVPRPDTETLIEHALELLKDNQQMHSVLDLGTGSGCIAITIAYLRPALAVTASDVSPHALEVARLNARHLLSESPLFLESDLFAALEGGYDLILSNPPYLTSAEFQKMRHRDWPEPAAALDGGEDGLDYIRTIIDEGFDHLQENGYLVLEAGIEQTETITELFERRGYREVQTRPDLSGRHRTVGGRRPGEHPRPAEG
jgi:release factor glutamine methyltransferase